VTGYRCSSCGNRTRFDVESTTRTRAFHHYSLGGEERVEDETVLERRVASVSCRWCGSGASVEAIEQVADEPSPQ
jgi:transposase